jgi:uncharacterized protein YqeY
MINIDELIKQSRLCRDSKSLLYYQNIKTEFVKFEKEKGNSLSEETQFKILSKYCKKLEDAEKQYSQADREDLATECREELEVLKKLLPKPVEAQDINSILAGWCVKNNFVNTENESKIEIPKKSMGLAIKAMKEVFPTADGKIISEIVKQYVV